MEYLKDTEQFGQSYKEEEDLPNFLMKLISWAERRIFNRISKRVNFLLTRINDQKLELIIDGNTDKDEDGNWRLFTNSDGDLVIQTRLSGTWTSYIRIDSTGNTYIGDVDGTNFSQFEPDGTYVMNGAATVFSDIVVPLSSAKVPAANAPTWSAFIGNLKNYTYGINDFQEFGPELKHSYKGGATIQFHIHGAVNGADVNNRTVKFEVEYTIADVPAESGFGDVYPATITVNAELTIPAGTTDLTGFSIDIGDDTSGDFVQGAIVKGRVRRIASSGTEPTSDPFLTEVGIHIESDTIGTRTATSK